MESFERFERDLHFKVHFAGDDSEELSKSKLYVRSQYCPTLPPPNVDSRIYKFELELRRLFYKRISKTNFTNFQEKLFNQLRENDTIAFALADKGLGPVAIELERYIQDGLIHLKDTTIYKIIGEEQALIEAEKLRSDIFDWTVDYYSKLSNALLRFMERQLGGGRLK